ncbi:MAG: hypothetical protein R3D51_00500 [Hyphomicrobiaceae bacterium]
MTDTTREYLEATKSETARPLTAALQKRRVDFSELQPKDPKFRAHIPPDHHPDVLNKDDGLVATAKGHHALEVLWNIHEKLIQTALQVQDRAKLATQVEGHVLKAIKNMREEIAGLDRQHEHHTKEIASSLGTGVGQLQAEVRSICRDKPEGERLAFVRALLAAGDIDSLKAIAAVSPVLSGLDAESYAYVREEAERLVNPRAFAERAAAAVARERCARALADFDSTMAGNIARWRSGDDQKIADLMTSLEPKKDA